MNKMNKKGFTLIEMLVVIAIIAVLVAIIIPTISSATVKAEAAANAANLRSLKAEIVTAMLSGDTASNTRWDFTKDANGKITGVKAKTGVTLPFDSDDTFKATPNAAGTDVTVTLNDYDINDYASQAEKGGELVHVS